LDILEEHLLAFAEYTDRLIASVQYVNAMRSAMLKNEAMEEEWREAGDH
jgi:hypothetical protein